MANNNHGIEDQVWLAAISEVRNVLIKRARLKETISYVDLIDQVKTIQLGFLDRKLFDILGEISEEEHRAGRGMLSALVVHSSGDCMPGEGFFELAKESGHKNSDRREFWEREKDKVHAVWAK